MINKIQKIKMISYFAIVGSIILILFTCLVLIHHLNEIRYQEQTYITNR